MICFNCGQKLNTEHQKECMNCGVRISYRCEACHSPNPMLAKFCISCGARLNGTDSESSVHNFDTLIESRKNVAVIFADISGFTALSEKMDPEDVRELINDCFEYITKPVYEMEGTIDKYIGDCVMILFGAKYIHSDDARRAVLCAVRMLELIKDFSLERLSAGMSQPLNLSVGINYGLVVTGSVGNYFDKDYTVMGDIVNTAQRLQSGAGSGTILVSESVYKETRDAVYYSDASEISVKNKDMPIRCYSPVSINNRIFVEPKALFMERDEEINRLNTIYNKALNDGTQFVMVTGEAGIGKTRLLNEFTDKISSDVKIIRVDCNPAIQNRNYHLMAATLMNIMNINQQDGQQTKQHRLISYLEYILSGYSDDEIKRCFNFLSRLMGLGADNEFRNLLNSMTFDSVKRETLKQIALFFVNLGVRQRVLVAADDVHWADAGSLELFGELRTLIAEAGMVFIFCSRYAIDELKESMGEGDNIIHLTELSEKGTRSLACSLLGCRRLGDKLSDTVTRFTRGNPLYLREFIANIKRQNNYNVRNGTAGMKKGSAASLPDNIQNLILSNLSQLDDDSRTMLQAASVLGRDFPLSLAGRLLDHNVDEMKVLKLPLQLNIISLKSVFTASGVVEKIFSFTHDMEREVIYDSILNRKKKEYHKKAAELIEMHYSADIESYYEVLAEHFLKAGMPRRAADYHLKTALKYKESCGFKNALEHYAEFVKLVSGKTSSKIGGSIADAYRDMGYMYWALAEYDNALECLSSAEKASGTVADVQEIKMMTAQVYKDKGMFDQALAILDEIEPGVTRDNGLYGRLLQMRSSIFRITGNPDALKFAKKSEKVLRKAKDYYNLSETMKQAGMIYFIRGEIDNALFYMNKSYKYAQQVGNLEIMARVSGDLGIIYHSTGMVSKAAEALNQSLEISREISYQKGSIAASINLGILYMDKGLFSKAEKLFGESLRLSRETMSRLYECASLTNLGDVMLEKGLLDDAEKYYTHSSAVAREINVPVEEAVNLIGCARIGIKRGQTEQVPDMLEKARKLIVGADELSYLIDYYLCMSSYELMRRRGRQAMEYCDMAMRATGEYGDTRKRIRALTLKADIEETGGQLERAAASVDEWISLAMQTESDYELANGYNIKARILDKLGSSKAAQEYRSKAKKAAVKTDGLQAIDE